MSIYMKQGFRGERYLAGGIREEKRIPERCKVGIELSF